MMSHVKNAAITTASVLAVIFVLNMFAPTRVLVSKALTPPAA